MNSRCIWSGNAHPHSSLNLTCLALLGASCFYIDFRTHWQIPWSLWDVCQNVTGVCIALERWWHPAGLRRYVQLHTVGFCFVVFLFVFGSSKRFLFSIKSLNHHLLILFLGISSFLFPFSISFSVWCYFIEMPIILFVYWLEFSNLMELYWFL